MAQARAYTGQLRPHTHIYGTLREAAAARGFPIGAAMNPPAFTLIRSTFRRSLRNITSLFQNGR